MTLPFVRIIPTVDVVSAELPEKLAEPQPRTRLAWIGIAAIVISYVNIGAYWANIELAAEAAGLDGEWAGQVISWSVLLSFFGCFVAMYVLKHFDYEKPILITFLMMVIAVGLLAVNISAAIFVFSVAMFNFLWIFIDVYQMGGVSAVSYTHLTLPTN